MLARSTFQVRSKKLALPSCQSLNVPKVIQLTQRNARDSVMLAMARSNASGVTPEPASNASRCCAFNGGIHLAMVQMNAA